MSTWVFVALVLAMPATAYMVAWFLRKNTYLSNAISHITSASVFGAWFVYDSVEGRNLGLAFATLVIGSGYAFLAGYNLYRWVMQPSENVSAE